MTRLRNDSPTDQTPGELIQRGYRAIFGWRVNQHAAGTFLTLGCGIDGIAIQPPWAVMVAAQLRTLDHSGPVLLLNVHPRQWVFLVEPDGDVVTPTSSRHGVAVITSPRRILLPTPAHSRVMWVVPPRIPLRLSKLGTVLELAAAVVKQGT